MCIPCGKIFFFWPRSSIKCQGHIFKKMALIMSLAFHKHIYCLHRVQFQNGKMMKPRAEIQINPFPHLLTPLGNKPFENTMGKGEIARNKQFLLFPQCFLPVLITFYHFCQI